VLEVPQRQVRASSDDATIVVPQACLRAIADGAEQVYYLRGLLRTHADTLTAALPSERSYALIDNVASIAGATPTAGTVR
jgi:hypothetical protein